ncbi:MAG: GIY-YIG nuclease family protein [Candidatus Paceibacterota bacterium]|jgi:putative endonuclease
MYYVYVLEDIEKASWYIGFSENLKKRLENHNASKGCKTTRSRKWKIIYFEGYLDKKDALGREIFLKSGSGRSFLRRQIKNYLNKNS